MRMLKYSFNVTVNMCNQKWSIVSGGEVGI